ncbi:MAG: hypothetical protein M3R40_00990, partial [Pseudomonadota bacterium]|nr:hypothetical protein [Pseudomonadota bacterium]
MKWLNEAGRALPFALLAGVVTIASANAAAATRQVPAAGTTSIGSSTPGTDQVQNPEFMPGTREDTGVGSFNRPRPGRKNGKLPKKPLDTPNVATSAVAASNPELSLSFLGLNHRDQRLANGGNQFSVEPPDQGLCVGNGYVVEAVNSVLRVFDPSGAPLSGVQDLNTFFGYAAAINRTTGAFGADVIDPICHYDPVYNRFVVAITTLHHAGTTSAFNGKNTIDVAVSNSGDPTGAWTVYH